MGTPHRTIHPQRNIHRSHDADFCKRNPRTYQLSDLIIKKKEYVPGRIRMPVSAFAVHMSINNFT
jgi:hypothetical protein